MIYGTRKVLKAKYNKHKELNFRSLRNYSVDVYKQVLERPSFPNYDNFHNPDIAYNNFINRLDCVVNTVAPFKTARVKSNTSKWFDGETADVDEEIYKEAQNVVQSLIRKKKKAYFEEKLKENTKNPKKLWKTLKQLGLLDKRSPSTNVCLEAKYGLTFDPYTKSEVFKKIYFKILQKIYYKGFRQQLKSLVINL